MGDSSINYSYDKKNQVSQMVDVADLLTLNEIFFFGHSPGNFVKIERKG